MNEEGYNKGMRQHKFEIRDTQVIDEILKTATIGRLGTIGNDGFPYITPVNYAYWQDAIYFHCAKEGEKLDNIRRDARVCFEIDLPLAYLDTQYDSSMPSCSVTQFYQSIIIRGMAELVEEREQKVGALNALMQAHEPCSDTTFITEDTPAVALCSVVCIKIKSLTCKANLAQKKSSREKDKIRTYLKTRNTSKDRDTAKLL